MPDLGPIPREPRAIQLWVLRWPAWRLEHRRLETGLRQIRQALRDQGEAEARRGERTSWWNLPQRQRQTARLRYLQHLRLELEEGSARLFQVQAVETQWREDLATRASRQHLAPPLRPVLQELREQAEKDNKYRDGSI